MSVTTSVKAVGDPVYDLIADAVGADTVSFAANRLLLVIEDFTPAPDLDASTLTFAAHGMTVITSSGSVVLVGVDPLTGDRVFLLKPPAGGWHFVSSGGGTYSFTVFGWVWLDAVEPDLRVAGKFLAPITIDTDGMFIDVDGEDVAFRLPVGGLT